MTNYVIDAENNITAYPNLDESQGVDGERFSNEEEFAALTESWPASRLIEIWNGIPGLSWKLHTQHR